MDTYYILNLVGTRLISVGVQRFYAGVADSIKVNYFHSEIRFPLIYFTFF